MAGLLAVLFRACLASSYWPLAAWLGDGLVVCWMAGGSSAYNSTIYTMHDSDASPLGLTEVSRNSLRLWQNRHYYKCKAWPYRWQLLQAWMKIFWLACYRIIFYSFCLKVRCWGSSGFEILLSGYYCSKVELFSSTFSLHSCFVSSALSWASWLVEASSRSVRSNSLFFCSSYYFILFM